MPSLRSMSEIVKTVFNLSYSQVIGCYDSGAHLYRWAEVTDDALEHKQRDSDPQRYAAALVENML